MKLLILVRSIYNIFVSLKGNSFRIKRWINVLKTFFRNHKNIVWKMTQVPESCIPLCSLYHSLISKLLLISFFHWWIASTSVGTQQMHKRAEEKVGRKRCCWAQVRHKSLDMHGPISISLLLWLSRPLIISFKLTVYNSTSLSRMCSPEERKKLHVFPYLFSFYKGKLRDSKLF